MTRLPIQAVVVLLTQSMVDLSQLAQGIGLGALAAREAFLGGVGVKAAERCESRRYGTLTACDVGADTPHEFVAATDSV